MKSLYYLLFIIDKFGRKRNWKTKVKFIVVLLMFVLYSCCLHEVEAKDAGLDIQKDWRVGVAAWSFNKFTFFEAIDKTVSLGLGCIESFDSQRISKDIPEKMGQNLSDEILAKIKGKLDSARIKLTSHYFFELPSDERRCRQAFEFGRKLGMETFVCEPEQQALDTIEKLCNEYGINLAIHNHPKGRSRYWHPREVLKVCRGRSKRIGACGDTGHWVRSGISPVEAVKMLQGRLISFHIKDLNKFGDPNAHDVPWGSGKGQIEPLLAELHRQGVKPTLFGIEYEHHMENSLPEIAECVRFFNRITAKLAGAAGEEQQLSRRQKEKIKVAIVTGGHDFAKKPFLEIFEGYEDIEYVHHSQADDSEIFEDISQWPYDCLVLYNMSQKITQKRRRNFLKLLNRGVGIVALHHVCAAFQDWPEFRNIIGCKAYLEPTTDENGTRWPKVGYQHDVDFNVHIARSGHLITRGMSDFKVHDEIYWNYYIDPANHVLLSTNHPRSAKILGWVRKYRNSRVFYMQPGHGTTIYGNKGYRRLVSQAIRWVASQDDDKN